MIYLDTDEIVLQPIEDLWAEFDQFNSSQVYCLIINKDLDQIYRQRHLTAGFLTKSRYFQLVSIAANGNRGYENRRGKIGKESKKK